MIQETSIFSDDKKIVKGEYKKADDYVVLAIGSCEDFMNFRGAKPGGLPVKTGM